MLWWWVAGGLLAFKGATTYSDRRSSEIRREIQLFVRGIRSAGWICISLALPGCGIFRRYCGKRSRTDHPSRTLFADPEVRWSTPVCALRRKSSVRVIVARQRARVRALGVRDGRDHPSDHFWRNYVYIKVDHALAGDRAGLRSHPMSRMTR
jgi:hypothetical protein